MVALGKPLRWRTADQHETALLADLQGNILKGHGRRSTRHLFLEFGADKAAARAFVRKLELFVTSAAEQLRKAEVFKTTGASGGVFVNVFLSFEGYRALGVEASAPADPAFRAGMRSRGQAIGDPPVAAFEPAYHGPIHAMILIAGDPDSDQAWTSNAVDTLETRILNLMSGAARVVASESGRVIFDHTAHGIEHFGYVDGRSQPLFLEEDVDHERTHGGVSVWDPAFPLGQVLVSDPGSRLPTAFGSYLVFRKLEQNVRAFKAAEAALGAKLGNGDLAGASLVGRWEDGTALALSCRNGLTSPISNDFDYSGDPSGDRCPLHAHVRKTNPRGESVKLGVTLSEERAHLMARRAIPYGRRSSTINPQDRPSSGVGLLFMAFQSDITNQFEFTQATWADNPDFIDAGTGHDPIIGQTGPRPLYHNLGCNEPDAGRQWEPFGGHVTLKGGEYFFAPAKSTLARL